VAQPAKANAAPAPAANAFANPVADPGIAAENTQDNPCFKIRCFIFSPGSEDILRFSFPQLFVKGFFRGRVRGII
jgi:hypothetical protein